MTAFLIDIATIKKIGFVNKNVDDPIISTTLRRVQDTMILPILVHLIAYKNSKLKTSLIV